MMHQFACAVLAIILAQMRRYRCSPAADKIAEHAGIDKNDSHVLSIN
jgi:hypothetical protein